MLVFIAMLYGSASASDVAVFHFESGLQVAVHPHEGAGFVSAAMTVGVGQLSDPEGAEGSAHLLEHLWFRSGEGPDVMTLLDAAGCDANAWTGEARTTYATRCPPERLELLLDLEARRVGDPLHGVTDAEARVERQVVGIEVAERAELPGLILREVVADVVYGPSHPMVQRMARGHGAGTVAAARVLAEEHHTPRHSTLALTGNVDMDTLVPMLTARFGPLGEGAITRPDPPPEPRRVMRLESRSVTAPVLHPQVVVAWPVPGLDGSERGLLQTFLQVVLDDTLGSLDDVTSVDCVDGTSATMDPLYCVLNLSEKGDSNAVAAALQQLVSAFARAPIEQLVPYLAEGADGRRLRAARVEDQSAPTLGSEAVIHATTLHAFGRVQDLQQRIELADRTGEGMVETVRTWMDPSLAVVMTVRPRRLDAVSPLAPAAEPLPLESAPRMDPVAFRQLDLTVEKRRGLEVVRVRRPDASSSVAALYLPAPEPLDVVDRWLSETAFPVAEVARPVAVVSSADGEVLVSFAEATETPAAASSVLLAASQGRAPTGRVGTVLEGLSDRTAMPMGAALAMVVGEDDRTVSERALERAEEALGARRLVPGARLVLVGPEPDLGDVRLPTPGRPVRRTATPPRPPERRERTMERAVVSAVAWRCALGEADSLQRVVLARDLRRFLWQELRERRGIVYAPVVTVEGAQLTAQVRTPHGRTEEALEVLESWRRAAPQRFPAAAASAAGALDPARLSPAEIAIALARGDLGEPETLGRRLAGLSELGAPPLCGTPAIGIIHPEEPR